MQKLNFQSYPFRFRKSGENVTIFDQIRKKFVVLTPEEWVRQHVVSYLISEKLYPISLINVEKMLKVNGITKRYDVVVFNSDGSVLILVECKAPQIPISQHVFDQIARYNLTIDARYLMLTNGLSHYYCQMDFKAESYNFLPNLPDYPQLVSF
ncbi:MAG: type I restriction enzyme HsdR N-terminal domain-containing protein [Flavobacterium sp.]|nr:type I restriction enzyme HsdR N-terminal domain-containing protein [Flavobacterium sp.]